MKLYVWSNPYDVSYGCSMVFAIAENVKQARIQASHGRCYIYNEYDNGEPPKFTLGKPLRVVKLPCAEWHEWRE
jgi:hypothetical protein